MTEQPKGSSTSDGESARLLHELKYESQLMSCHPLVATKVLEKVAELLTEAGRPEWAERLRTS